MRSIRVLPLCAAMTLGACHKEPAPPAAGAAVTSIKPKPALPKSGPTAAEQTLGMVLAASQGKSQAVDLKFDLAQKPKVGQPLDVNLALIAQVPGNPASVQVSGNDGLAVARGGQFDIPVAEPGEVYKHTVSVTPETDGVLLLGVTVSLKHDDVSDTKTFTIPIIAER